MNRFLGLLFVSLCINPIFGQSSSVISSAGSTNSTNSMTVSWTVGDLVVTTDDIHQGYQYPYEIQELITAIEEQFENKIKMFPNPANNVVHFVVDPTLRTQTIALTDVSGRVLQEILSKGQSHLQFDVAGLSPGVYFLVISTPSSGSKSYKLIKK